MPEPSRSQRSQKSRRPELGQTFLASPTAPYAIVDALGDVSSSAVLEIGPGKGALTRILAERSRHLIAVELDRSLAQTLQGQLSGETTAKVEILCQDILSVNLAQLSARFGGALAVVGNLPYYVTSQILLHLFEHHGAIDRAVLMVQREVADRIVASPGSREYGLLSATTQMHASVESLFTLPPGAFSPPPKVYSTVLRLYMHPLFAEFGVDRERFLPFLRQIFAQKRKTLANNFRAAGYDGAAIREALASCHLQPMIRAEAISLETMARLFRILAPGSRSL